MAANASRQERQRVEEIRSPQRPSTSTPTVHTSIRNSHASILVQQYVPVPVQVVGANPQKTVQFLLRMCYGTHNMLDIYYLLDDCIELRA